MHQCQLNRAKHTILLVSLLAAQIHALHFIIYGAVLDKSIFISSNRTI